MSIKFSIFGKCSRLLFSFLILNFLFCLSCGYVAENNVLSKSEPTGNTNSNSQKSEPELVVQKFMEYVSENKLKEANDLVKTEQEVSGTPQASQENPEKFREVPIKPDWAQVFKERNYSLYKIVSNDVSENEARVKALLNFNDKSSVKMGSIFSLKNVNGQWYIYDIDFITDGTLNK